MCQLLHKSKPYIVDHFKLEDNFFAHTETFTVECSGKTGNQEWCQGMLKVVVRVILRRMLNKKCT